MNTGSSGTSPSSLSWSPRTDRVGAIDRQQCVPDPRREGGPGRGRPHLQVHHRAQAVRKAHKEDRRYGEVIIAVVQNALLVLDGNLRVRSANRSFYETFHTSARKSRSKPDRCFEPWRRPVGTSYGSRGDSYEDYPDAGIRSLQRSPVERASPRSGQVMHIRDFLKRGAFRGVACGQFP